MTAMEPSAAQGQTPGVAAVPGPGAGVLPPVRIPAEPTPYELPGPRPVRPVLRGRRATVRLDDEALTWTRGRVTRHIPLTAVTAVELRPGLVRISTTDGEPIEVACPSPAEAELFTI